MQSLSCDDAHHLLYYDKEIGVQMEVHTPVLNPGRPIPVFGKGQRYFSFDGTKRIYKTWAACERAMRKRKEATD